LCRELAGSLVDLAEDESWARGQAELIERQLTGPLSARGLKAAGSLLHETRQRQGQVRSERVKAREAMNAMVHRLIAEVGELGVQTGRFSDDAGRYAQAIEQADSLEVLADTVREMVDGTRAVKDRVQQTQARMSDEHARAAELSARVNQLEAELQRLSSEVSTDALTGVANRRGLTKAFEVECARAQRSGQGLAVALLDIDNFKRLNDTLGHAAGDQALVSLAQKVQHSLRPTDHVARYGGEEFVVLLPGAGEADALQVLARLQRELTASLFIHDDKPVLVTFSAGLTLWRESDSLDGCLERADEALYEAKRTGKNRTCVA
jgi:diguanylate cyclase